MGRGVGNNRKREKWRTNICIVKPVTIMYSRSSASLGIVWVKSNICLGSSNLGARIMWCLYTKSLMSLDEGLFWGTVTLVCPEFGPVDFLGQKKKKSIWRKWQPTPALSSGKFHGCKSLVGYSPRGRKELDTTERLHLTLPKITGIFNRLPLFCKAWTQYW